MLLLQCYCIYYFRNGKCSNVSLFPQTLFRSSGLAAFNPLTQSGHLMSLSVRLSNLPPTEQGGGMMALVAFHPGNDDDNDGEDGGVAGRVRSKLKELADRPEARALGLTSLVFACDPASAPEVLSGLPALTERLASAAPNRQQIEVRISPRSHFPINLRATEAVIRVAGDMLR